MLDIQIETSTDVGHRLGLGDVDGPLVKLVKVGHVIDVGVSCNSQNVATEKIVSYIAQAGEAERCVDDNLTVASAKVPNIAAGHRMHVRLKPTRERVTCAATSLTMLMRPG